MEIYILRHGIAVERGTGGYEDDSKRPLTPDGEEKMKNNARGIKALGIAFDTVFSSPYVRAQQTAVIVARAFGIEEQAIVLTKNLVPDAAFEELITQINGAKADSVLLVGHEPHLSDLIAFLLTGKNSMSIDLKKGGFCCLSTPKLSAGACAQLNWLLTPGQLRKLP